ncbi:MAG TPA: response regulator [Polyangiaceae bacterium]|jgi:CheY-like chemotaxis protein|nr:response regulator [Polyangiaceae bacterium]
MKILVVEDQESIRHMIEALVKARGYSVEAVASGARALEAISQERPDVVLLDMMMPGQFDGLEVCRRLRANPETESLPVLIITAFAEDQTRDQALAAGATAFYTKPFSPIALLKDLQRLDKHAS